jgi:hypothetical protein
MPKRTKRPNRGGMAFGRNIMVLAMVPFVLGTYAAVQGALTLSWPRANATIIGCERVWPENDRRNIGSPDNLKGWSTAHLTYFYVAKGQEYTGSAVQPYALGLINVGHDQQMCLTYQPHQRVEIAYDADKPDIAYLEPGPSLPALMLSGLGAFMLLCGWRVRVLASRGLGTMNEEGATERIKRHRNSPGEWW